MILRYYYAKRFTTDYFITVFKNYSVHILIDANKNIEFDILEFDINWKIYDFVREVEYIEFVSDYALKNQNNSKAKLMPVFLEEIRKWEKRLEKSKKKPTAFYSH